MRAHVLAAWEGAAQLGSCARAHQLATVGSPMEPAAANDMCMVDMTCMHRCPTATGPERHAACTFLDPCLSLARVHQAGSCCPCVPAGSCIYKYSRDMCMWCVLYRAHACRCLLMELMERSLEQLLYCSSFGSSAGGSCHSPAPPAPAGPRTPGPHWPGEAGQGQGHAQGESGSQPWVRLMPWERQPLPLDQVGWRLEGGGWRVEVGRPGSCMWLVVAVFGPLLVAVVGGGRGGNYGRMQAGRGQPLPLPQPPPQPQPLPASAVPPHPPTHPRTDPHTPSLTHSRPVTHAHTHTHVHLSCMPSRGLPMHPPLLPQAAMRTNPLTALASPASRRNGWHTHVSISIPVAWH